DAAEVMVALPPAAHLAPSALERGQPGLVDARLRVDQAADGMKAGALDRVLRRAAFVEDRPEHTDERGPQARAARRADGQLAAFAEDDRRRHHAGHPLAWLQRAPDQVGLAEHAVQVQVEPR